MNIEKKRQNTVSEHSLTDVGNLEPINPTEVGWVQASEIGMILDDESLSISQRRQNGQANSQTLKTLASTRQNLILDGTYLIDVPHNHSIESHIQLFRVLEIKGGCIIFTDYLFFICQGGGLKAKDTTFRRLWLPAQNSETGQWAGTYPPFFIEANTREGNNNQNNSDGILVECFELLDCDIIGANQLIRCSSDNILSNDSNTFVYKQWRNPQSVSSVLGIDSSVWDTANNEKEIYYFDSALYEKTDGKIRNNEGVIAESQYKDKALYGARYADSIFKTDAAGGFKKIVVNPGDISQGDVKYDNEWVRFEEAEPGYSGERFSREQIQKGMQGIKRFVLDGCHIAGSWTIVMNNLMVNEEFRITKCHFKDFTSTALNFGSSNQLECASDWNYRSVPLWVTDSIFEGPESVISSSLSVYHCAVLYEGPAIFFFRNVVRNIMANNYAVYDTYFSARKVFYEDCIIQNVIPIPRKENENDIYTPSFEWGKSKGGSGTYDWQALYDEGEPCETLERVYRRNVFEVDTPTVWKMVKDYFEGNYELFKRYSLQATLLRYTTSCTFERIVWEDNRLSIPDGALIPGVLTSNYFETKEFIFSGNSLSFANCGNMPLYMERAGSQCHTRWLFSIQPVDGVTVCLIIGNRFESLAGGIINMACFRGKTDMLRRLTVRNNLFNGCFFRMTGLQAWNGNTLGYAGDVKALHVDIGGNSCDLDAVVNEGADNDKYSHFFYPNASSLSDIRSTFGDGLATYITERGHLELRDGQERFVAAPSAKSVKVVPVCGSMRICVTAPYLCRPVTMEEGALADDRALHFAIYLKGYGNTLYADKRGFRLRVTYTMGGVMKAKLIEAAMTTSSEILNASTQWRFSLRDSSGLRHGEHMANASNPRAKYIKNLAIPFAEEVGLMAHVRCVHRHDGMGCLMDIAVYTSQTGTLNDLGTDIVLELTQMAGTETVDRDTALVDYTQGFVTPMEVFVPKGSVVSSEWRMMKNQYKDDSGILMPGQQSILAPSDTGYWVVDNLTGRVVVWNGSNWSDNM